jgi:K+-transporting ATPase A subunit
MSTKIGLTFKDILVSFFVLLLKLSPLIAVIFISTGDKFLPSPLSDYSVQARTNINNFLLDLFPKDVDNRYNNKRSDEIIKQIEEGNRKPSPR